jgi:hypothetical protein
MNTIIINKKSYKLYEGKRGGKYIMKGGKKIYQKNLNKEQTGSGFFGKDKKYNVSIKSPDMKHSVELVCEVCKEKEWKVEKALISKGRLAAYFDTEWFFDKSVRTCSCITCGNMKWFKNKKYITKNKV